MRITLKNHSYRLLLIILTVAAALATISLVYLTESNARKQAEESALREAITISRSVKVLRDRYTSEIIEPAKKKGSLITHNYKSSAYDSLKHPVLPLPATFSMDVASRLGNSSDTKVELYSIYPFPNRAERRLSEFQLRAWDYLYKNHNGRTLSDKEYIEIQPEKDLLHYASADLMVNQSCVNCHNNHPDSPKTDWKTGDLRGVIAVSLPLEKQNGLHSQSRSILWIAGSISGFGTLLMFFLLYRNRQLMYAAEETAGFVRCLAEGKIPEEDLKPKNHEIDQITESSNRLRARLREISDFIRQIGNGNLDTELKVNGPADLLGNSLILTQKELLTKETEEKNRRFIADGLAGLLPFFQQSELSLEKTCREFLNYLLNYTDSWRGLIYLRRTEAGQDFLQAAAHFGFDAGSFNPESRFLPGEGRVGICAARSEIILTDRLEARHFANTATLGNLIPAYIIYVPIIHEQKTEGVLEIAGLHDLNETEKEFFRLAAVRLSYKIAGLQADLAKEEAWTRLKINQQELLEGREELRQNTEELRALNETLEDRVAERTASLHQKQEELLEQNEEMRRQQEEILEQRQAIEAKTEELERSNRKMADNEKILRKSLEKLKQTESEARSNLTVLQETQEEINRQSEALIEKNASLEKMNKRLISGEKVLQKSFEKMHEKESRINASIRAAFSIQQALLPTESRMKSIFKDHFVIYLPKDVVSGDFYWAETTEDKIFAAAIDCTGHGVPGAFMSMISNSLLSKIILLENIWDPARILEELDREIRTALKQEESGDRNGMDAAVLVFDQSTAEEENRQIEFAGAKNPLFYLLPGASEMSVLPGERRSVGGRKTRAHKPFSTHRLSLPPGTLLYIGSDGLEDQNNAERRKFGKQRIFDALISTADRPLEMQKKMLSEQLNVYMYNALQRDDILLLGIKI